MEMIKNKKTEKKKGINLNDDTRKILRIFLILFAISYLLSASYGFTFNKILAKELGSKYSCFRYDTIEACTASEYLYNSLIIFPRHFLFEIPIGMLTNLGSIFEIFSRIGIIASLIILYNFSILIILIYLIMKNKSKDKKKLISNNFLRKE